MNAPPSSLSARPRLSILLLLIQTLVAASVHAHPGHGLAEHGPLHLLGSPYHLALSAVGLAVCLAAVLLVRHHVARRVMIAAGAAALAAGILPWIPLG